MKSKMDLKVEILKRNYKNIVEFCAINNLHYPRIARIIKGDSKITIDDIVMISKALKACPMEIFFKNFYKEV